MNLPGPRRSSTERLELKRYETAGERAYCIGTMDGGFPPMGSHIRGAMGGIWALPMKLFDGFWISLNGEWLPAASRFTTGAGFVEFEYPNVQEVSVKRLEFADLDRPVVLACLTLRNESRSDKTFKLGLTVRSRILGAYPWDSTKPTAKEANKPDAATQRNGRLIFQEQGKPWYAVAGSTLSPTGWCIGDEVWGPVSTAHRAEFEKSGPGIGGVLEYEVSVAPRQEQALWFAFAGSHQSLEEAETALDEALADPQRRLQAKIDQRGRVLSNTKLDLPEKKLVEAIDWAKLNKADLVVKIPGAGVRDVREGKALPEPAATLELAGISDGLPDYSSLYGTGSGWVMTPLIACGMWEAAKDHLRSLRNVSRIVNGRSGKLVHEISPDGSVYFGNLEAHGNSDETGLFASAVDIVWRWSGDTSFMEEMYDFIVDGLHWVTGQSDWNHNGWPRGSGVAERPGMGAEQLQVTVATWIGLRALSRMAEAKGDRDTLKWTNEKLRKFDESFEADWWIEDEGLYADSRCNPGDEAPAKHEPGWTNVCQIPGQRLLQKLWIGITPVEVELSCPEHAHRVLDRFEGPEFTGPTGIYLVGREGGPDRRGQLKSWTVTSSSMAVAEARFGRLGEQQLLFYMRAIADCLDLEMPGAVPELAPSEEYDVYGNLMEREMFVQAWATHGLSWTAVSTLLGVEPDVPKKRLEIIPQIPPSWPHVGVTSLRVGDSTISVMARREGDELLTEVETPPGWELKLGHMLPLDAKARGVSLDGTGCHFESRETNRGIEYAVVIPSGGRRVLRIDCAPPAGSGVNKEAQVTAR
jgi:glycogen debranching enzyme